eukprot:3409962-Amphidinium_carterae.1
MCSVCISCLNGGHKHFAHALQGQLRQLTVLRVTDCVEECRPPNACWKESQTSNLVVWVVVSGDFESSGFLTAR